MTGTDSFLTDSRVHQLRGTVAAHVGHGPFAADQFVMVSKGWETRQVKAAPLRMLSSLL